MPKTIPVPDALDKPFWDAVNEKRLLLQFCTSCERLQYPIKASCVRCGSGDNLDWKEAEGKGHILETLVVHDTRVVRLKADVPFNVAIVSLDEDPDINFLANLPGTPVNEAPQGAPVEVVYEEQEPGQFIHDWKVIE